MSWLDESGISDDELKKGTVNPPRDIELN